MDTEIIQKAESWLNGPYDEETKKEIRSIMQTNEQELTDRFYRNLEFGTGGLRGVIGAGTNRMNIYTVAMATQGLANYCKKCFQDKEQIKAVIAYDSRRFSREFADVAADVFSANGIFVYLFDDLRPTPELSFAVRHLTCTTGIVITASHNPPEYNGYKVYWNDGAQITAPHDKNIIGEVNLISHYGMVKRDRDTALIKKISTEVDTAYLKAVKSLSLNTECIKSHSNISIVYSPIHGSGITAVPASLKNFGFTNVHILESQSVPDGNFPTVKKPNPEEQDAMKLACEKAAEIGAELVLATDPDADRVGIAVKDLHGAFTLLNGNQTGSLIIFYLLSAWKKSGKLTGKEYVVKTIVTTDLIKKIADSFNVDCINVLTGFKYIAEIIGKNEGKRQFIGGGEESYGYLAGEFVRDKDAVIACSLIAEMCAWAKENKKTLFEVLLGIYARYGFYYEKLISITKKGKSGVEEIQNMMKNLQKNPPEKLGGKNAVIIRDYAKSVETDCRSKKTAPITLPKSAVLQFELEDGSIVTARPSGTEPKIKFYCSVKTTFSHPDDYETKTPELETYINAILTDLGAV